MDRGEDLRHSREGMHDADAHAGWAQRAPRHRRRCDGADRSHGAPRFRRVLCSAGVAWRISAGTTRRRWRASPSPPSRISSPRARPRGYPPHRHDGADRRPDARTLRCSKSSTTTCRSCWIPTLADLTERGLEIRFVTHPILAVERDASGKLVRFAGEALGGTQTGTRRESLIQVHLQHLDAEPKAALTEALDHVYADVRVAVRDWAAMRSRITEVDARLPLQPAAAAPRRDHRGGRLPRMAGATTISPCSACASTGSRTATSRPIPWRARASASCRPQREGAAARARARGDDARDPRLPAGARSR